MNSLAISKVLRVETENKSVRRLLDTFYLQKHFFLNQYERTSLLSKKTALFDGNKTLTVYEANPKGGLRKDGRT